MAESSALWDCEYQRIKMGNNEHVREPTFFSSSCFLLFPYPFSSPLCFTSSPLSPTSSHNYPLSVSTSLLLSLTVMLSYSSPLSSHVDPPLIPPCRIITTSLRGPASAPCTSPTRGVVEEATTASLRRRQCLLTGLEPSTSTITSLTGNPPP